MVPCSLGVVDIEVREKGFYEHLYQVYIQIQCQFHLFLGNASHISPILTYMYESIMCIFCRTCVIYIIYNYLALKNVHIYIYVYIYTHDIGKTFTHNSISWDAFSEGFGTSTDFENVAET